MARSVLLTLGLIFAAPLVNAEPIRVVASQDLTVMRGERDEPKKSPGIHPKRVKQRDKSPLDRFALIRFDSDDLGRAVRGVALRLTPRSGENDSFEGRHRFRVYAVRDGDPQDERFTEKTYEPGAAGALFDGSRLMIDRRQVATLGSFSAEPGQTVTFTSRALTAFIRTDTNATATIVLVRATDNGKNSVFKRRTSRTPPTLLIQRREGNTAAPPPAKPETPQRARPSGG